MRSAVISRARRTKVKAPSLHEPGSIAGIVSSLLQWFLQEARVLPWRQTLDPYGIWISEIMLQQTQVKTVIAYWERWMREFPDVRSLAAAPLDRVLKLWEGLGYYTRAKNLQRAAQTVVTEHGGAFPQDLPGVLELPGIGPYTAGAICSIAYNAAVPILDGNVIRVLSRLFAIDGDPRESTTNRGLWSLAETLVMQAASTKLSPPQKRPFLLSGPCSSLNQSLMELGALICTPRAPRCGQCPLRARCRAFATNRVEELPRMAARLKPTARHFVAFAIERRGHWLVRQRPAGSFNAHLWEFPAFEVNATSSPVALFRREFGIDPRRLEPLEVIRHSITRYRMTLQAFCARRQGALELKSDWVWRKSSAVEDLALTSAHRKLWNQVKAH